MGSAVDGQPLRGRLLCPTYDVITFTIRALKDDGYNLSSGYSLAKDVFACATEIIVRTVPLNKCMFSFLIENQDRTSPRFRLGDNFQGKVAHFCLQVWVIKINEL